MLLSYSRSAALITSSLLLLLGVQQHIPLASAQEPSPPPVTSPTLPPPHNLSTPVLSLGADIPASAATNQLLTFSFNPVPSPGVTTGTPAWTFGDGATASGPSVTHAYRSPGSYEVGVKLTTTGAVTSDFGTRKEVAVEDSAVLQPGDSITFASPFVIPPQPVFTTPGMAPSIPRGGFGPLNVVVENQSDQQLSARYDYDSSQDPPVVREAQVGLALPEGYALQVLAPQAGGISISFSSRRGCAADGDQVSQMTCLVGTVAMDSTLHLTVMAAPARDVQVVTLPPRSDVALSGPSPAGGDLHPLVVASNSDQETDVTWDGSTLAVAAPEGYAVSVESARNLPPQATSRPIDCREPDGQPNALECPLAAVPPVQVTFRTVARAPSGTFSLRYSDDAGLGTMTIANTGPDAATGGAAIDVSLLQTDTAFRGSGVMRPGYQPGGFLLAFELADAAGDRYLFQAQITADAGRFSGKGLWLSEADETQAGGWSVGTPSGMTHPYSAGGISVAPPPFIPGTVPSPGTPLPSFTGSELIGAVAPVSPGPGQAGYPFGVVQPPTIGLAGQALTLLGITTFPCCGSGASRTYQWSFGDGTTSAPISGQTVTHTWAKPGVYTVAVVFTDETGVSTFALTQIRIAASTQAP